MPTVSGGLSVMTTGTLGTPPSSVVWWDSIREYRSRLLFVPSIAHSAGLFVVVVGVVVVVVVVVDRFYIALFSALEQTHCARV